MKEISRRSRSYRLYSLLGGFPHEQMDLCSYVRFIVMKLMLFSGLSLLALMCLFMMIWSWVLGFQGIFLWDVGLYDEHTWTFIIGYLVTIFVVVSICKILYDIFLQEKIWRWQEERKWKKIEQERREGKIETLKKVEKKPREPGLFRMWLRARKEQVCPLIKFVD